MRRLKDVWPDYKDEVAFFALDIDPSASLASIEGFRVAHGHPWPAGQAGRNLLSALSVLTQSTKVAFDADGIIVYRARYGQGDVDIWRELFEELAAR